MGDRDLLLKTIPPELRDDIERVYAEVRTRQEPDLREFLAELHQRGMLDSDQLRETIMAIEADRRINRVDDAPDGLKTGPKVLGPLGAGAMGEVLLAKDELGRVVAVKKLLPKVAKSKGVRRRFYKEAQVTAQLGHPGIVPIYGLEQNPDGTMAYSMKLVRGRTLEDYIEDAADQWVKKGSVDSEHELSARLQCFLQVCDAMAYAHDRGVVHRDLKPENIMVGAFADVIVMDWGIAKLIEVPEEGVPDELESAPRQTHKTRVGMLMGTPRYMSPEQAHGKNDVLDYQSDQYALGVILQELVTLVPAVKADLDLEQCLDWARNARRLPFTVVHRKAPLPKQLVAIVDKACQLDPGDRYPSVSAMAADIRCFLRDEPISAMRDGFGDKLGRWVARNRGKVMLLIMFLFTLGVVATAGTAMFGVTAVGAAQYRAAAQEERIKGILHATTEQAIEVESAFLRWNGQLSGLAASVEQSLIGGARFEGSVPDPYRPPPGIQTYPSYKQPVSLDYPDLGTATTYDKRLENDIAKQILVLGGRFRSTFADSAQTVSSGRPGALRNAINGGVPIVWSDVYTSSGFHGRYPGREGLAGRRNLDDFTNAPWFKAREEDREIRWGLPHIDPDGLGLLTRASRKLSDNDGDFFGVVTIDVSLQWLHDDLLTPPPWAKQTWLLDKRYDIVVSSTDNPAAMTTYEAKLLPEDMRAAVKSAPFGTASVTDGQVSWARLETTGWYFVMLVEHGAVPTP